MNYHRAKLPAMACGVIAVTCACMVHADQAASEPAVEAGTTSRQTDAQSADNETRVFKLRAVHDGQPVRATVSVRTKDTQEFVRVPKDGVEIETAVGDSTVTYVGFGEVPEGEEAYRGKTVVAAHEKAVTLKLSAVNVRPTVVKVLSGATGEALAGVTVEVQHYGDGVLAFTVRHKTADDGSVRLRLQANGYYRVLYHYPRRRLPVKSDRFVPAELGGEPYVFRIPPRKELSFRVRFLCERDGVMAPLERMRAVMVFRETRGGGTWPLEDGVLHLAISSGDGIDEFLPGERIRLRMAGDLADEFTIPAEAKEFTVGSAGEKIDIELARREWCRVSFDVRSADGEEIRGVRLYLRSKDQKGWRGVGRSSITLESGKYTCLVWKYGYRGAVVPFNATTDRTVRCVLEPARTIQIAAVDTEGNAWPGAAEQRPRLGGRLEYDTDMPIPRTAVLRFDERGVARVFYDTARPGLAYVGTENTAPVIIPLVKSQSRYTAVIRKGNTIRVTLDAAKYEKEVGYAHVPNVSWITVEPFRERIALTRMTEGTGEVRLAAGSYVPILELAGTDCPPELVDRAVVFEEVKVDESTTTLTIRAKDMQPFDELTD